MAASLKDLTSMVPLLHENHDCRSLVLDPHSRRSSGARRWRSREFPFLSVSGGVVGSIANWLPLFIKELDRLLKQPRRGRTRRHGCLENIKADAMPVDRGEGTRSIGVGELQ